MKSAFDLLPLTVGFDRLNSTLLDHTFRVEDKFPPHNIIKESDSIIRIELAVAGYTEAEIEVLQEDRHLKIIGKKRWPWADKEINEQIIEQGKYDDKFIHRGIALRNFEKHFVLADNVNVLDVSLQNGLLSITTEIVIPEAQKPKRFLLGAKSKN